MTIRVGIIGVGVMGADHAHKLNCSVAGAEVTAVADFDGERATHIAGQMRSAVAIDTGTNLIHSDFVDAVVIASHDSTHAELAAAALDAGKPILCEKPLAPTAAEARSVWEAEQATGRSLIGLGFMRRFDPSYTQLRELAYSGELGEILAGHCISRTVSAYPGGDSASTITNAAIHELDIVPWLLNSPIKEVSWHCGRSSSNAGTRRDPQILLLRSESDVLVTVEIFLNAQYGYDTRCELVGETGVAALTLPTNMVVDQHRSRSNAYPADWIPRYSDAYRLELQEWVDSIEQDRPSTLATAEDGVRAALVADALVESMNNDSRTIEVDYTII